MAGDPRVVFVGNLDRKVSEEELRVFGAGAGVVESASHLRKYV